MKTEKLKVTKQMCERAQSICNKNCESCAWYEGDQL